MRGKDKKGLRLQGFAKILIILLTLVGTGCGSINDSSTGNLSRGGGTGITNRVNTPAEMGIGDIIALDNTDGEAYLDFTGVSEGARFILITGTSNTINGTTFNLSAQVTRGLGKDFDIVAPAVENIEDDGYYEDGYGPGEILSAWLRAAEDELSEENMLKPYSFGKSLKLPKVLAKGMAQSFYVLNSFTSANSYTTVTARAKCIGSNVAIFVDVNVGTNILSDDDIENLCNRYDVVAEEMYAILGESSDVNGDGLITVLLTPQINKLGAMGGGIITGYFFGQDLSNVPNSNMQEIIYALVPDPDGKWGVAVSKSFVIENLLSAVFPHELQHLISYNWHRLINGGPAEAAWLNEAMSHLMEDVMGYNRENPSRYAIFLANPSRTSLVANGSPNLQERGASYLFLRFLYEQSSDGNQFLRRLIDTKDTGVDNIEAAFAGSDPSFDEFSEFMARWSLALALTDRGISSDPRYTYRPRTIHPQTGNWQGVVINGEAHDGRGTLLTGVNLTSLDGNNSLNIVATSAKFFEINYVPGIITIQSDTNHDYAILLRTE